VWQSGVTTSGNHIPPHFLLESVNITSTWHTRSPRSFWNHSTPITLNPIIRSKSWFKSLSLLIWHARSLWKGGRSKGASCTVLCRSAYFRLGHLIQERVPCNTVLALTATATKTTQQSIREVLRIPEESTIRESELPSNLRLAVQDVRAGHFLLICPRYLLPPSSQPENHRLLSLKQQ
jgi:hypothetical protein